MVTSRHGFAAIATLLGLFTSACAPATGEMKRIASNEPATTQSPQEHVFGSQDLSDRFELVDGYAQSAVLPAADGATRGGFLLDIQEGMEVESISVEARGILADGSSTPWVLSEVTFREGPHQVSRADFGALAQATQIRIPLTQAAWVAQVTYSAVVPDELEPAGDDAIGHTQSALDADLGDLVQPRGSWGARASQCSGADQQKYRVAIHHTYTPASSSSGYGARLRSIQAYHMDTRGWCDIGYHFLITEDGAIWEGRPLEYRGAHVADSNSGNVGISWVGCFQPGVCASISSSSEPHSATVAAGSLLLAKLSKTQGLSLDAGHVKSHREHPGASTECPGDNLAARISEMLTGAANADSAPAAPPVPSPTSDPQGVGKVVGVVWDASTASTPASTSAKRITSAAISADGGPKIPVRVTDAFWELELGAGPHAVVASATGYSAAEKKISVVAATTTWASVGLFPDASGAVPGTSFGQSENSWSCAGVAGKYKNAAAKYYVTSFGCWVDSAGKYHGDGDDNCIPWCMSGASAQGRKAQFDALCAGFSGPDCERNIGWYAAGADRFGCGSKLKVSNPKNAKSAVVAVLDRGPACWVEDKVDHWVLDLSYPASYHLFGEPKAVTEKGLVVVEPVDDSTPLGPSG